MRVCVCVHLFVVVIAFEKMLTSGNDLLVELPFTLARVSLQPSVFMFHFVLFCKMPLLI